MKRVITPAFIVIVVMGCFRYPENPKPEQLQNDVNTFFTSLLGTWKMDEHPVIEQWEDAGDLFTGKVYNIIGVDTALTEEIRIIRSDTGIFYEAKVMDQNQGKPVYFKLTAEEKSKIMFENPKHDFPQQILYEISGNDHLEATIQGRNKSEMKTVRFRYSRIH
jgi:hypothetical protein